jgi:capsular exopolysaccharide synthesis family protein
MSSDNLPESSATDANPQQAARVDRVPAVVLSGRPLQGHVVSGASVLGETPDAMALVKALRRRWLAAITFGIIVGAIAAAGVWFFLPKAKDMARSTIQINPPASIGQVPVQDQAHGADVEKRYIARAKSQDVLNSVFIKHTELAELDMLKSPSGDPVEALEKILKVEFLGPGLLSISVTGDAPDQLVKLATALAEAFVEQVLTKQYLQKVALREHFHKMALQAKNDFEIRNKELELMTKDPNADDRSKLVGLQALFAINNNQLTQITIEIERLRVAILMKEKEATGDPSTRLSLELEKELRLNPEMRAIKSRRTKTEELLAEATKNVSNPDENPGVKRLRDELEKTKSEEKACRERLAQEIKDFEAATAKWEVEDLRQRLNRGQALKEFYAQENERYEKEINSIQAAGGGGKINLAGPLAAAEVARQTYTRAEAAYEALKLETEGINGDYKPWEVLGKGELFRGNDLKRRSISTAGAGLSGFLLVLLGVAFVEFRARKIQSPEDVARAIGLCVVGTLPALPTRGSRLLAGRSDAYWQNLMTESVDAFRTLLLYTARSEKLQVIMVTSAVGGEGKTSLSSHLAASLARAGRKTLLLDFDTRKPAAHIMFDTRLEPGLCELLREEVPFDQAVHVTAADCLKLMPAGRCDAIALKALAQGGAESVFRAARAQFEFLVVDTPPVLPVADSLLIGEHVDAVVFSVLREVSRLPPVRAAYLRLEMLGIRMLGAVVNGTREQAYGPDHYYVPAAAAEN